jgi:hypothetical protein
VVGALVVVTWKFLKHVVADIDDCKTHGIISAGFLLSKTS